MNAKWLCVLGILLSSCAFLAAEQRWLHAGEHGLRTDGTITGYALPNPGSGPTTIALAQDGTVWFTESNGNRIGRMNPDGSGLREFDLPNPNSSPRIIALGADGNIWFSEFNASRIGRITPAGVITEFPLPRPNAGPGDITAGADGHMWFVELSGKMDGRAPDGNRVGRITMSGQITEFPIPTAAGSPINIAVGPDRNVWFTKGAMLGRVTPDGVVTEFPLEGAGAGGTGLTAGSDRQPPTRLGTRLWVAQSAGNRIAFLQFQ
jgi:virginiamycin B lyase